jgi:hypothetical protein
MQAGRSASTGWAEVSPGHLAPREIGTMLVEGARFVKEPTRPAGERRRSRRSGGAVAPFGRERAVEDASAAPAAYLNDSLQRTCCAGR